MSHEHWSLDRPLSLMTPLSRVNFDPHRVQGRQADIFTHVPRAPVKAGFLLTQVFCICCDYFAFLASEWNWPSPAGTPPGCRPKAACKHVRAGCRFFPGRRPAFPTSRALCFQAWEKSASGWSSLRALAPEPGGQLGGPHSQAKAEPHAHVCSCPCTFRELG